MADRLVVLHEGRVLGGRCRGRRGWCLTLRGTAVDPTRIGKHVRVTIRPQGPTVVSPGAPVQGGSTTSARVSVVEYLGRNFGVGVRTPGRLSLHARSDHAPQMGSAVDPTADPARVLAYRTELEDSSRMSVAEHGLAEVRR